jgi:hypothetical protein
MIKFSLSLILATLVSCSSAPFPEGLKDAQPGMDKDSILNLGGNPARTYHEKGQDHWIYDYITEDGRRMLRQVVFEDGVVVSIGPVVEKAVNKAEKSSSEDGETLEQFEKKLRDETQKLKGEFKDID